MVTYELTQYHTNCIIIDYYAQPVLCSRPRLVIYIFIKIQFFALTNFTRSLTLVFKSQSHPFNSGLGHLEISTPYNLATDLQLRNTYLTTLEAN